jgi:PhnB protein
MELEPYLFFSGNCEEALNFYKGVFGGEISGISRWKDAPPEMGMPADLGERIMHSNFKSPTLKFMASDSRPTTKYGEGRISLSLGTTDLADAQRVWDALAKGGTIDVDFADTFWGAKFGMVTDKFGVDWMINCENKKP